MEINTASSDARESLLVVEAGRRISWLSTGYISTGPLSIGLGKSNSGITGPC